jgi:hypothetical protein
MTGGSFMSIRSNASKTYLTERPNRWVQADGIYPLSNDFWYVCALDPKWVEISFLESSHYLGRHSSGYLVTNADVPNGNTLWRRSEFNGFNLTACVQR